MPSRSARSRRWKAKPGRALQLARAAPPSARDRSSRSGCRGRRPSSPRRAARCATWKPMKPAAPVTRTGPCSRRSSNEPGPMTPDGDTPDRGRGGCPQPAACRLLNAAFCLRPTLGQARPRRWRFPAGPSIRYEEALGNDRSSHDQIRARHRRRQRALRHPRAEERALGGRALARGASPPTRSCSPSSTACRSASCPATGAATGAAVGDQLPRQHRRPEARRRHRPRLRLGLRLAEGGATRPAISCSSTSSSTAPSRARRASSAPAAWRTCRWPIPSARRWPT